MTPNAGSDPEGRLAWLHENPSPTFSVLPADDSSLHWSEPGSGITEDPPGTLEKIFWMVTRYDEAPQYERRSDDDIWRKFKRGLESRHVLHRLQSKKIVVQDDEVEFPYAWKNEQWHCLEPLSFDLTAAESIRDPALLEPVCQASLIRYSGTNDVGPSRLLFSNPASTNREKLTIRLSDDGGRTWPVAKEVYSGPSAYSCCLSCRMSASVVPTSAATRGLTKPSLLRGSHSNG